MSTGIGFCFFCFLIGLEVLQGCTVFKMSLLIEASNFDSNTPSADLNLANSSSSNGSFFTKHQVSPPELEIGRLNFFDKSDFRQKTNNSCHIQGSD